MLQSIWILAQANNDDSLNEWLKQNPVALGTIFLVLSVGLIIAGIVNLQTGVTRNKLGMEFRGGIAHLFRQAEMQPASSIPFACCKRGIPLRRPRFDRLVRGANVDRRAAG